MASLAFHIFWQDEEDIKPLLVPVGLQAGQLSFSGDSLGSYPHQFRKSRSKINDETRREIVKIYLQNPNMNQGEIADMFGIDRTTVSKLLKRKHEYLDATDESMLEASKKVKMSFDGLYQQYDAQRASKHSRKCSKPEKLHVPKLTQAALQRKLLSNRSSFQQPLKTPMLSYRGLPSTDILSQYHPVNHLSAAARHKFLPSLKTNPISWVTEDVKVKDEPEFIEIDESTRDSNSAHDQSGDGDTDTEQALIQRYFNLQTHNDSYQRDSDDDEQLVGYFQTGKSSVAHFLGSLQRKDPGRDKKRHLPTAQTVTSNSALDPAMRLKVSTHGDNQYSSHRIPKEKPGLRMPPTHTSNSASSSHDAKLHDENSDVIVKTEIPEDLELNDTEAHSRDMKSLEKFREQQRAIEEANKQKKALLSKTLSERRKKAQAEAHKLEHIQKELAKLDNLLTADVQVIRHKIEGSSRDFLEAQKRYQKAEEEYIEAKMDLHNKSELKEQLTEHLYTIIHQNEVRKAKKLAQLMQELEMENGEEDFQLPELPPLSSFQPIISGPLSPHKIVHPITENSPDSCKSDHKDEAVNSETNLDKNSTENVNSDKNSENCDQNESLKTPESCEQTISSESQKQVVTETSDEVKSTDLPSERKTVESESKENECSETDSLMPKSPDKTNDSDDDSIKEKSPSVKVGGVLQYVKDRKAQVNVELETVEHLIEENDSNDAVHTGEDPNEQPKTSTSWDFSGEVNNISTKEKS